MPAGAYPFSNDEMFTPDSFWRKKLDPAAPLHPDSARWARNVCEQFDCDWATPYARSSVKPRVGAQPGNAWFSHDQGGSPLYVVGPDTVTQPVHYGPVLGSAAGPLLQETWMHVPLPSHGLVVGNSGDRTVCVWQPATDTMWEFYVMTPVVGFPYKWQAKWGGTMRRASQNSGRYSWRVDAKGVPWEWPEWGHTATSLPVNAGAIQPEELDRGFLGHTLQLTVGDAAREFLAPARRTDGSGQWWRWPDGQFGQWRAGATRVPYPDMVPEGARLRFPADTDLSPYTGLTRLLVEALRDYGMLISDRTGNGCSIRFRESSTYRAAGLPSPWPSRFTGWPHEIIWAMPLQRLQVVLP